MPLFEIHGWCVITFEPYLFHVEDGHRHAMGRICIKRDILRKFDVVADITSADIAGCKVIKRTQQTLIRVPLLCL